MAHAHSLPTRIALALALLTIAPRAGAEGSPPPPPAITPTEVIVEEPAATPAEAVGPATCGAAATYARIASSVVRIEIGTGVGTGFAYGGPRRIATAYHVADAGTSPWVVLRDGGRYPARVTAVDEEHDLAILDLGPEAPALTPIPGRADQTVPGLAVLAIGHPSATSAPLAVFPGNLNWSVSQGIVSTVGERWIQTDVSLNPGNSGGPLVDCQGRLVGVASRLLPAQGRAIGFATPAEALEALAQEPPLTEGMKHGWHATLALGFRWGWGDGDGSFRYGDGITMRLGLQRARAWAVWLEAGIDVPWDAYHLPDGVVSLERRQSHVSLGFGPRFVLGTSPFAALLGLDFGCELSLIDDHGVRLHADQGSGTLSADAFDDHKSKLIPTVGARVGIAQLLPFDLDLGYAIGVDLDRGDLVHRLFVIFPL